MNKIFFIFFYFLFKFNVSQDGFIDFNESEIETTESTALFSESKDLAICTCDLHIGICDYHCCCDQDCPTDLLDTWKRNEIKNCIEQKTNNRMKDFDCMSADKTYKYNANEAGIKYKDQISNLLCVEFDNGKDMGEYYEDISSTFTSSLLTNRDDYKTRNYLDSSQRRRRNLQESSGYSPGDQINITINNDIFRFDIFEADSFGYCQNTTYVSFGVNINKKSCLMQKNNQQVKQIDFFKNINSINSIDRGDGTLLTISLLDEDGDPIIFTDNTVIEEINIKFIFDNNIITQATATLKTKDIDENSNIQLIKQKYSVSWSSDSASDTDTLPKSGNPGYIIGKNLLIGKNSTDNTSLIVNTEGFSLKFGEESNCQSTSTSTNDNPIKYGVNTMVKCKMSIANNTSYEIIENLSIFADNKKELGRIGKYGCANPQYRGDWIDVNNTSFNITKELISDNLYNVTTTAYFIVLTSKFGPKNNPQNYILSTRLLTMNEMINLSSEQTIEFKFYVKYVPV